MKILIIGILMALGSIWAGFYISSLLEDTHWAIFPLAITGIFGFMAGFALMINGIEKVVKK